MTLKYQKQTLVILAICLLSPLYLIAQNKPMYKDKYTKEWKLVDSFTNKDMPQSAETIVKKILNEASQFNDYANVIKAKYTLMNLQRQHTETELPDNITYLENEIKNTTGVEKALWQNMAAKLYWQYYQNNRWQILNRTNLQQTTSPDITTWGFNAFIQKVTQLYIASLTSIDAYKSLPVEQLLPIIAEGENTRNLRPTLYDLMVNNAISFFESAENNLNQPANKFELNNPNLFSDAASFSSLKINTSDSGSLKLQALLLYQQLIAFHINDPKPDALIDADLNRLEFVYNNTVEIDKDALYLQALRNIENKYQGNSSVAQVAYLIQQQLYNHSNDAKSKRNLPQIKKDLQAIIDHYPKTEGSANAHNLIQQINIQSLSATVENVVIPNEYSKALITYKNVPQAHFSLYKIKVSPDDNETYYGYNQQSFEKKLKKATLVSSWTQALPRTEDYEEHTTEIKIDPLPVGNYILALSNNEDKNSKEYISSYATFQVSNLTAITSNDKNMIYVVDRNTGQPISNVKVHFYQSRYNNKTGKYESIERAVMTTNDNGQISAPHNNNDQYISYESLLLEKGNDSLWQGGYTYYSRNNSIVDNQTHTFFFTDRTLYRPGQTIYYKGIVVENNPTTSQSKVVANHKETITFYNTNGDVVNTQELTTNEFGSFSGSFTAPESGLTGEMRISNTTGSTSFNVEEYKRPKFYVDFDTIKENYALNQKVKIKGFAKAYAGNNIDGAQVKYRVVRNARFPYYWCFYRWGMPSSPEMEITNGTATTQADGSFEINFQTIPDRNINEKSLPVFTYTIYADVTDINGETRSGSSHLSAGYRSLQISANVPENASPKELETINVSTQNLNGVFTPAKIALSIAPLEFPGTLYRKRLWPMPENYIISEAEFRKYFPNDEYKNESDYHYWTEQAPVFASILVTKENEAIKIPQNIWSKNGWYVITLKAKDLQGNDIEEKKYVYIWDVQNTNNIQQAIILQSNKKSYQPGDKATLELASAYGKPYLLYNSSNENYNINQYAQPIVFQKTITESDRGNIAFSYLFVHQNRIYTDNATLYVPWSNKDLNIEWATHRDKLLPGEKEQWTMTIKGDKKDKVSAELLAGMYDASLDAFKPFKWSYDKLVRSNYVANSWNTYYTIRPVNSIGLVNWRLNDFESYNRSYDYLIWDNDYRNNYSYRAMKRSRVSSNTYATQSFEEAMDGAAPSAAPAPNTSVHFTPPVLKETEGMADADKSGGAISDSATLTTNNPDNKQEINIRTNLNETAFFFPQMQTDSNGNIVFSFTMPEALTEWKMMAFAHTKDWKTGFLEDKVKTQKDLMVVPNLPRFFRQGDSMVITSKIISLTNQDLNGTATIDILNATTMQPLNLPFRISNNQQTFTVKPNQSTTTSWTVHIPESIYTPVVVRITAKAGNFSDGEENTIPVITNRMLVTETLPMPVNGNNEDTFELGKLVNANSNSLVNHALTVEFTGNPAWYAVQALPYLMEYPYECAEQTFNRFYANALAAHIVAQSPKVEAIFNQWKDEDTAALLSNLSKNEELKSALLEETPWVMEAKTETEQKHNIALLFQTHKLAKNLNKAASKLAQMQLPDGSFGWFNGMSSNRYITQYIITGLARLQHLGVQFSNNKINNIIENALPYLDNQIKEDYDNLIKYKSDLKSQNISYIQIEYLYLRSFYSNEKISTENQTSFNYYKTQANEYWSSFNPYMKGLIALALNRWNNTKAAQDIIASLKETAVHNKEMGMYWKTMPKGYWWYEAPIEAQALLIETFKEVAKDETSVNELKVWLLKQKQTQNWATTKATADACYALLLSGSDWLSNTPEVTIHLGTTKTIRSSEIKTQAGTGYFKQRIEGRDVTSDMGHIKVQVDNHQASNSSVSWGAVYWQYFEDLDKITPAATPLSITKQMFIKKHSNNGEILTEIKDGNQLKVGDKVTIRLVIKADRAMEYVHLKDMRGACFEPTDVLSTYQYQGGLGYYQSTKDVSTNFFFDRINKGTYVLEYTVFVSQKGSFSNGIVTLQCMYAPEFSSHSEGIRVTVQ